MNLDEITRPSVPVNYVLLTLEQAAERGLRREDVLAGLAFERHLEEPGAHIPLFDYGRLVARVLRRSGDGGLGYDFGLRAGLSSHGLPGFGLMNNRTLREAVDFAVRYTLKLRSPGFSVTSSTDGDYGVVDIRETVPFGPLRQYAFDMFLVGMTHIGRQYLALSEMELWFDCPEPEYYARYRDRLPPVRFGTGVNQSRCLLAHLDRSLKTADPVTAQLVVEQCERQMTLRDPKEPVLERVRALLENRNDYPDLETVAAELGLSTRTLKRRLQQHGFGYRQLLDESRRRDSIRLLRDTDLSIEEIAFRVGYNGHSNFIRAFRGWTGTTPASYRKSGASAVRG